MKCITSALSLKADAIDAIHAVGIHRAVIASPHAAVFRTPRGWYESVNTLAARPTVYDLAERVGTARVLARINAAMVYADGMYRTILRTGAVSLRLAAVHVRIAHVIRRASAYRIVGWTNDAERSRMAGIRMACLHSHALNVGHWIRTKSGRTLTDRFVIIRDADRVHAAGILVAGVVAGVRESIAELRWRAVDVIDAGYRTAPGR